MASAVKSRVDVKKVDDKSKAAACVTGRLHLLRKVTESTKGNCVSRQELQTHGE